MKASHALTLGALTLLPAMLIASPAQGGTDRDRDGVKQITLTTADSQGDFPFVTADLVDKNDKTVGFVTTNCVVVTSMTDDTTTCHGAYVLEDGQITWQNATRDPQPPYLIAITGGTGKYCEASGQIRVVRTESDDDGGLYELKVITGRTCATS